MSWAEVFKINKNMKRALNEQIQDLKCTPIRVITSTGTYSPEKTGLYRVICIGAGSDGIKYRGSSSNSIYYYYIANGSSGGVAIKDINLVAGTSYNITVSTTASFGSEMSATAGVTSFYNHWTSSSTVASGGIASGGDYNYQGQAGCGVYDYGASIITQTGSWGNDLGNGTYVNGTSVGVVLTDLSNQLMFSMGNRGLYYGTSILNYGAGAPSCLDKSDTSTPSDKVTVALGLPSAVIIVPLEMEE